MTGDELQGLAIMLLIVIVGYGPYDFSKYRRLPSFRRREDAGNHNSSNTKDIVKT